MNILIVNYHYIREIKKNNGIFGITFEKFKKQISQIGSYRDFISTKDILFKKLDSKKKYCLITFDDSLYEQIQAFECLFKNKIPFISFCSSYPYIEKKILSVHKIHLIFSKLSIFEIKELINKYFNFNDVLNNSRLFKNNYKFGNLDIKNIKLFLNFFCDPKLKEDKINFIFKKMGFDEKKILKSLYIPIKYLKNLSNHEMLGSHGHNHLPLGLLNYSEMRKDLVISNKFMYDVNSNIKIKNFSYPFGREKSYSINVIKQLKIMNYNLAFTMNRGINSSLKEKLLLKRVDTNDLIDGRYNHES